MKTGYDAIIIGAGIAGLSAAGALAEARPGASILLINGEDRLPYKRTQISKRIAAGYELNDFALTDPQALARATIGLTDSRVLHIDRRAKTITLDNGATVAWKSLLLATGATPLRRFSAPTALVRTARDGELLHQAIQSASTVTIIGAGVLGVEIADQMAKAGRSVSLLCKGNAIMPKELNDEVSRDLAGLLRRAGVCCRYDTPVLEVVETAAGLVVNPDGEALRSDLVVECSGTRPNIALASACGLETDRAIVVNEALQTSDPAIFAAGDCVQPTDGRVSHLWHQAEDQGLHAGRNLAAFLDGAPLSANPNRPRRLKCEAFGAFLFSLNADRRMEVDTRKIYRNETIYQEFGYQGGRLLSVVMSGDKERAKQYEAAVWDGLPPQEVERRLAV